MEVRREYVVPIDENSPGFEISLQPVARPPGCVAAIIRTSFVAGNRTRVFAAERYFALPEDMGTLAAAMAAGELHGQYELAAAQRMFWKAVVENDAGLRFIASVSQSTALFYAAQRWYGRQTPCFLGHVAGWYMGGKKGSRADRYYYRQCAAEDCGWVERTLREDVHAVVTADACTLAGDCTVSGRPIRRLDSTSVPPWIHVVAGKLKSEGIEYIAERHGDAALAVWTARGDEAVIKFARETVGEERA